MPLDPAGLAGQIAALPVGGSVSLTTRIAVQASNADKRIRDARNALKNRMRPYVARAKSATGGQFTTEIAVSHSHDFAATLVSVVVTRLTKGKRNATAAG